MLHLLTGAMWIRNSKTLDMVFKECKCAPGTMQGEDTKQPSEGGGEGASGGDEFGTVAPKKTEHSPWREYERPQVQVGRTSWLLCILLCSLNLSCLDLLIGRHRRQSHIIDAHGAVSMYWRLIIRGMVW